MCYTFRSVFAVKCGEPEASIDWGLKALKEYGDVTREDYVLELPMIDIVVHACEVLRRQGKDAEVAGLKQMLLKQCRVRGLVSLCVAAALVQLPGCVFTSIQCYLACRCGPWLCTTWRSKRLGRTF